MTSGGKIPRAAPRLAVAASAWLEKANKALGAEQTEAGEQQLLLEISKASRAIWHLERCFQVPVAPVQFH